MRAAILPDPEYHGVEEEQLRQAMLELAARLRDEIGDLKKELRQMSEATK